MNIKDISIAIDLSTKCEECKKCFPQLYKYCWDNTEDCQASVEKYLKECLDKAESL